MHETLKKKEETAKSIELRCPNSVNLSMHDLTWAGYTIQKLNSFSYEILEHKTLFPRHRSHSLSNI